MTKQIVLIVVGLICLTGIAYAGVSANYNLSWHVLSGGVAAARWTPPVTH